MRRFIQRTYSASAFAICLAIIVFSNISKADVCNWYVNKTGCINAGKNNNKCSSYMSKTACEGEIYYDVTEITEATQGANNQKSLSYVDINIRCWTLFQCEYKLQDGYSLCLPTYVDKLDKATLSYWTTTGTNCNQAD